MKKILVCGGAGYIGSHIVHELCKLPAKFSVVVFDNLSTGHGQTVPSTVPFIRGDIRNKKALDDCFAEHKPDAVMHFCASIVVPESCAQPLDYYENNVSGTIELLQAMKRHGVKYFIFSSTAALFGMPERIPIKADDRTHPLNPYGESKFMVEQILEWYISRVQGNTSLIFLICGRCDKAYGMKFACLRYFNACGADECGDIGEDHSPETHLIPLVLQVPLGKRSSITIYGDDYDTPDGTCVRDYVHVTDLATAHIKALEFLVKNNQSERFNLGCGQGYSVKEIIEAARKVTGHAIPATIEKRRAGDAASLVACSEKAEKVLGWKRKYQTIEDIVGSAWNFHEKNPSGLKVNPEQ